MGDGALGIHGELGHLLAVGAVLHCDDVVPVIFAVSLGSLPVEDVWGKVLVADHLADVRVERLRNIGVRAFRELDIWVRLLPGRELAGMTSEGVPAGMLCGVEGAHACGCGLLARLRTALVAASAQAFLRRFSCSGVGGYSWSCVACASFMT